MADTYAAENKPTRATKHYSHVLNTNVPEPTVGRLKGEYLKKLQDVRSWCSDGKAAHVSSLPALHQGRPLLLGNVLGTAVQDYIKALRKVGRVVTTAIVMAAEGIVAARDESLLPQHGGHIDTTKSWAKSLLLRMKYVNWKCSIPYFKELRKSFLLTSRLRWT